MAYRAERPPAGELSSVMQLFALLVSSEPEELPEALVVWET